MNNADEKALKPVEQCCICGLVIRDGVLGVRLAIPHYHWDVDGSYAIKANNGRLYEPTVCAWHANTGIDWDEFDAARGRSRQYATAYLNARLPFEHGAGERRLGPATRQFGYDLTECFWAMLASVGRKLGAEEAK